MGILRMLVLLAIAPLAQGETRVFVSLAGSLLQAEITAATGDTVTLRRTSDQQILVVSRNTLCKEDSAYITRWQEQHPDHATTPQPAPEVTATAPVQKYRLVCQTLPAKSNRGPANSDHRIFEHTYTFNISNQEVRRDLEQARGLALTLAKNVATPNGDLIVLQKEEFDVSIRAQSKMAYTTPPVRLTYSQDPDYAYGVKSYGYVLIIRDAAGNILLVEASPDASAKFTKEIIAFGKPPFMVDRDFKLKPKSEIPLYYINF